MRYKTRAIISVYDKTGIAEFARGLHELGTQIIATSGTAEYLRENGVSATTVSRYIGYPELFDGRLKTLHPKIHGGILLAKDEAKHAIEAKENGIKPIKYVIVNSFPIRCTTGLPQSTIKGTIDAIDEGGLALIINALRNSRYVTTITDPTFYETVLTEIRENGKVTDFTNEELMMKAAKTLHDYFEEMSRFILFRTEG